MGQRTAAFVASLEDSDYTAFAEPAEAADAASYEVVPSVVVGDSGKRAAAAAAAVVAAAVFVAAVFAVAVGAVA